MFLLETPKQFNLRRTLYSHGWSELAPFEIDDKNWRLSYVFTGAALKQPVSATISQAGDADKLKIEASAGAKISAKAQEKILRDARHILRLDDDLNEFYKLVKAEKDLAWIAKNNAGRLVRSPTVFEDLVKTLCTTNCNWAMTKKMTSNLVEKLGAPAAGEGGKRAFPTAEAMAGQTVEFYKNEIRAGYRALYFQELAENVANGRLNPETWLDADLPAGELKKEMKRVKGVGDYAAENLLKLVGRYDGLALDSWLRAQFYKKHNAETVCDDKHIERHYERFGAWRGLVMWCDMTRRWLDD